jgi:hypothetical protein
VERIAQAQHMREVLGVASPARFQFQGVVCQRGESPLFSEYVDAVDRGVDDGTPSPKNWSSGRWRRA